MFDYLIIGAGLCGSVLARKLTDAGFKVAVVERRTVTGGNIRTDKFGKIDVHTYGAHIFRTNDKEVWDFVNKFAEFNNFVNEPIANYKGEIYNLPFNMNTFNKLWGVITPEEAKEKIESQKITCANPKNLEEYVLNTVGTDIYEKLIKGYTEKQWGRSCKELDKSIIKRIPLRFTYNNNYFNARYQGIPVNGYSDLISRLLEGVYVVCGYDIKHNNYEWLKASKVVILTGALDEYYEYCYGQLEYRSLRFETSVIDKENFQGNAVVNYTDIETPYTRIIEHKHFTGVDTPYTVITKEYPAKWSEGMEKYYPVENEANLMLYKRYKEKACKDGLLIAGRLAEYKYYDMDDTVKSAMKLAEMEIQKWKKSKKKKDGLQ